MEPMRTTMLATLALLCISIIPSGQAVTAGCGESNTMANGPDGGYHDYHQSCVVNVLPSGGGLVCVGHQYHRHTTWEDHDGPYQQHSYTTCTVAV